MNPFAGKNIISIRDFTKEELIYPFELARSFKKKAKDRRQIDLLKGYVLCTLFYEPSTRTRLSFESAMQRLGGSVITVADAKTQSSAAKGENLSDAIKVMANFADIILLRHPERGAAKIAAEASSIPIINCGDGANEHPPQTFSELFTIAEEKGQIDRLEITFLGDLAHTRTMRSLAVGLSRFDVKVNFVSPKALAIDRDIVSMFKKDAVRETEDLQSVLPTTDVLYLARIQKERFDTPEEYKQFQGSYIVNNKTLQNAKKGVTIMHPLPRLDELLPELDNYSGACYFRQYEDALYHRMALLTLMLDRA